MSSLHGLLFLFDVPLGELIEGSIFLIFTGIYYLKHPENYYEQRLYVWNFKKTGKETFQNVPSFHQHFWVNTSANRYSINYLLLECVF